MPWYWGNLSALGWNEVSEALGDFCSTMAVARVLFFPNEQVRRSMKASLVSAKKYSFSRKSEINVRNKSQSIF